MAFGIGLVAALVALKKRNGETRLKVLQKRLKEKPRSKTKLFQYPVQKILSIVFIVAFAVGLQYFAVQVEKDMKDQLFGTYPLSKADNEIEPSTIYILPSDVSHNSTAASQTIQAHSQLGIKMVKLRSAIFYIHAVVVVAVLFIVLNLELKVVTALKGQKTFRTVTYGYLGLKGEQREYRVQEGDRLGIWQLGQTRFSNTNYYYSVRVINNGKSCEVLRKSCMFDAREAVLKLADQLLIPFSTKIRKLKKGEVILDEE